MFCFSRFRLCPTPQSAAATVSGAVSGKWSESVAGVAAPAPPGSNPFAMLELKVPTSALRIKNRLAIDMSGSGSSSKKRRQPIQLQPGPKITPPTLPAPLSCMRTLGDAVDATGDDATRAQSGIHRLWGIQTKLDEDEMSLLMLNEEEEAKGETTNDQSNKMMQISSSGKKNKKLEKIKEQQLLLDTDSFCPEDSVNNTIHRSLSCQATFSGVVVEVTKSKVDDDGVENLEGKVQSFVILVREPKDDSKGILLRVFDSAAEQRRNHNKIQLLGSTVVVIGSLRMKRVVYSDEERISASEESSLLPNYYTIPFVHTTKPIFVVGKSTIHDEEEKKAVISEMLSKVTII